MNWQKRIVSYGTEKPQDLTPHPLNFRLHPSMQGETVEGSLDTIGWVDELLVNLRTGDAWPEEERNVKTVINGHLRLELAIANEEEEVPCKFVDLDPDEERLVLAVYDETTMLAQRDGERLQDLIADLDPGNDALADLLSSMVEDLTLTDEDVDWLDEEDEDGPEVLGDANFSLGTYRFTMTRAAYEEWLEDIRQDVGFDKASIVAELQRRLQIDEVG